MTEKMITHLIDRSIRKQREIQKQIKSLKISEIEKLIAKDEQYQGTEILRFIFILTTTIKSDSKTN